MILSNITNVYSACFRCDRESYHHNIFFKWRYIYHIV